MSENSIRRIEQLTDAMRGLPGRTAGFYARMFYFSAITITTLGYGDIVPITTAARTAVAIEAILGVVLIGLFLNAVVHHS